MPGNEVAPLSPQEFNARRNDDSYLLSYQYTQSAKARSTSDRIAYSLSTEGAEYAKSNPPFIYPGPGNRNAVYAQTIEIKRGYIRRLTEFYERMKNNDQQIDNPSTLQNLRCNFQFNPSSITRSMQANYDMQFFFNQEPGQLAQPIPGQAGFAFELLFNREAEVHSKSYVGPGGGTPIKVAGFNNRLTTNPEFFINNTYDPSWVTEIGVLADIMILDDIVGQGLAKDLLDNINNNSLKFSPQGKSTTSNADDGDQQDTDATAQWDPNRLAGFSANLGNKAFLTPTPVRILFSPWFMVEGFVMSYNVTFNKFTPSMIPTQAVVAVQMQALYVGFAQQKTFLTDMPELADESGTGGPNIPKSGTPERDIYDQTKNGLRSFISKSAHIQGSEGPIDLLDAFFGINEKTKEINFIARASDEGTAFYRTCTEDKNGGGLTFTVKGRIEVYWDSFVNNASNDRTVFRTAATTSGNPLYTVGVPPDEAGTDYDIYGTSASPFVATLNEIDVYVSVPDKGNAILVLGQIRDNQQIRVRAGQATTTLGEKAMWNWEILKQRRTPFEEDKFNVSLELTIIAHRFSDPTYDIELPQKIRGSWKGITADADSLFENITAAGPSIPLTSPIRIS